MQKFEVAQKYGNYSMSKLSWPEENLNKLLNGSSYAPGVCTIRKLALKRLKIFSQYTPKPERKCYSKTQYKSLWE